MNNNNSNRIIPQPQVQEGNSLREYINLIKLNFVPIFLITLTGLIVAIIYAINAPNIYKSTTVLKLSKPQGSILTGSLLPEFQEFGSDRFIANEIEILKSYKLRAQVSHALIDSFTVSKNKNNFSLVFEDPEEAKKGNYKLKSIDDLVKMLASNVSIDQKRGLDIVEINVESHSPIESAIIANAYADAYKNINLAYNREQLTRVKDFLAKQREEKLAELGNVEETLKSYQEQRGIVELPEQAKALITQSSDIEAKKNATKIDLTISEKTLNQLKEELKKRNPEITNFIENYSTEPYMKKLQEQIADLKTRRDRAISDAGPNSKLVKDFDQKIADLESKFNNQLSVYKAGILASSPEEIKKLTSQVLEEETKYQALSASYRKLAEISGDYEKKLSLLPTSTIDLARLQREKEAYEKLYLQVEERYQEAIINEQSAPGNVLIIDEGLVPLKPAKPNRVLIVVIGFVLGIGLGIGFAFIRNYLDNTVKTPEDIQNRNINILAWIPQIEGLDVGDKEFEFIVAKKPDASASEAYRALRTRIKFSKLSSETTKTLLITSPTSGEGKTTTAVNLAGSFAQANFRTVILDADLRKPRVHTVFKEKRFPGFTDYFFGQASFEEIVRKSQVNNLDFITAGTIPPNPSEILSSEQMTEFFKKLKSNYDYIIVDSPPVIAVTDSEILSSIVDATILVVSANNTEIDLMEKAIQLLNHEHSTFIGTILNNFTYRSGYGSYYKYYYYYSRPTNGSKKTKMKVS
ncbi:GumC family protein [Stygiobacter electus]|uniref:non-specific protein-tyrosine kinase n=1 Tax=Stygiobacter electus TaxID=3032292 RepID=A0AAE3TBA4_9BACT|nr:polysaccharide biosynthesis tyrosine autokinase [Stygiobacter electus]MDF1610605.1 polysaccharide biosynthesis tyrosine autokinase [Stygiobacter electus]